MAVTMDTTPNRGYPIPNADPQDLVPQLRAMILAVDTDVDSVSAGGGTGTVTNTGTLTDHAVIVGNGTTDVSALASLGTTTTLLHGNAAGDPTWGAVALASDVSGQLPLANGGTGANLSDPGANKLLGWDDTDNAIAFFAVGSGLSYDHTTHTLSGSGANAALSNLASVAINTDLLLGTSDGGALGSPTKMWSDLFLASGGVINWNNGDVTLTHSSDKITVAGGTLAVPDDAYDASTWNGSTDVPTKNAVRDKIESILTSSGFATVNLNNLSSVAINASLLPAVSDAVALGSTTKMWSDLFLASTGIINWNNGGITIAETADSLVFAGASAGYYLNDGKLIVAGDGATRGAIKVGNAYSSTSAWMGVNAGVDGNGNSDVFGGSFFAGDVSTTGTTNIVIGLNAQGASHANSGTINFLYGVFGTSEVHNAPSVGKAYGLRSTVSVDNSTVTDSVGGVRALLTLANANTIPAAKVFRGEVTVSTGTVTDLRGLDLSGWTASSTVTTSYGIYMDTSIDVGTTKYAIYSLSTSPSLLTGGLTLGGNLTPSTNDGAALGTTALMFSDLHLAAGAVVNFNNGDVTLTHSANALAFAGATSGYSFDENIIVASTKAFYFTGSNANGRDASFKNNSGNDNFAQIIGYPGTTGTNVGMSFAFAPKGTGFSAAVKCQMALYQTDIVADTVNYERLRILAAGTSYQFAVEKGGTGVIRPVIFNTTDSVVIGSAALATTATDGFLYIPSCAGAPTGTPTTYTGRVPLIWDSTNHKLYVYSGGAWKGGTTPGAFA